LEIGGLNFGELSPKGDAARDRDLEAKLAAMDGVTDCVSGLLANYAFGGGGGQVCLAEEARTGLEKGMYGLRDFYAQLATAPSFTRRAR